MTNSASKAPGPSAAPQTGPASGLPDDNARAARLLLRAGRAATLCTTLKTAATEDGAPYGSLVTIATDHRARPILLLSGLSDHTRNLGRDARAALLVTAETAADNPQQIPRVTVTGRLARSDAPADAARFLARHPYATRYAGFGDFAFWRMEPERFHLVGGFARAVWLDAERVLTPETAAAAVAGIEPAAIAHMNDDHRDAARLMARRLLGERATGWRVAGIDADGVDLALGNRRTRRLAFDAPAASADDIRPRLVTLTAMARNK